MGKILSTLVRGSVGLGTLCGIEVYLHWTWLAMIAAIFFFTNAFTGVLCTILFACILAHEYGHALVGAYYGYPAKDIYLLPIGGVARFASLPHDKPKEELWITLAGPFTNFAIAIVLVPFLLLASYFFPLTSLHKMIFFVLWSNVAIGVFNFIPMFPMDGGRILRALCGLCGMDFEHATFLVVVMSKVLSLAMGIYGCIVFVTNGVISMLPIIAIFIYMTAGAELERARREKMLASFNALLLDKPVEDIHALIDVISDEETRQWLRRSVDKTLQEKNL